MGGGGANPLGKLANIRAAVGNYAQFRGHEAGDTAQWPALQELADRFLAMVPAFERFGDPADGPVEAERAYKLAAAERVRAAAARLDDPEALGAEIVAILRDAAQDGPLLRWQTLDTIAKAHPAALPRFHAAVGNLVLSDAAPDAALADAFAAFARLKAEGVEPLRMGEQVNIAFCALAMMRPDAAVPLKITLINDAARILDGEPIFGRAYERGDYARFADLFTRLFAVMRDDWDWGPRDWYDVQTFLWIALRYDEEGDAMTDDQLLEPFYGNDAFRAAVEAWPPDLTAAFCTLARTVHEAGLDWWHVDIRPYQLRFGIRGNTPLQARWVAGSLRNRMPRMRAGLPDGALWQEALTPDLVTRFAEALSDQGDVLRDMADRTAGETGSWPDALTSERGASAGADPGGASPPEPSNLILYGPPGTGKTYRTAEEAVRLCEGAVPAGRVAVKARYDALVRDGRIRFVTFHQNFSYEEFVEGLRPETGLGDLGAADGAGSDPAPGAGFRLEAKAGIFRELCADAGQARTHPAATSADIDLTGRAFWKMSLGEMWNQKGVFDHAIEDGHVALGWGGTIDWSDARFDDRAAIQAEWERQPAEDYSPSSIGQLHPFRNTMQRGDIVIVAFGNSAIRAIGVVEGDYYFEEEGEPTFYHRRRVRWLVVPEEPLPLDTIVEGNFTMRSFYSIAHSRVNLDALARLIAGSANAGDDDASGESAAPQQFVLIIDEINRANISKVFGELITLIEPDKRLGIDNALTVRLPYSKREFGVPANLHIVGTMNTADRSIALLDTALRRRFRFEEIAPDPGLIEPADGIDLAAVLTTINDRIEYLLDRDHAIGHAFFMGLASRAAIDDAMRFKVIPLLQEYFFEDWARIHAVLGDGFVTGRALRAPPGIDDGRERTRWAIRTTFLPDAYARLLRGAAQSEADSAGAAEGTTDRAGA